LAPRVPQANRGEAGIAARAVHVELELPADVAVRGRERAFDAEAALPRAQGKAAVLTKLVRERRQLRRPDYVVPVRVVLLEIDDSIGLTEAVDLEGRRLRLRGGRER